MAVLTRREPEAPALRTANVQRLERLAAELALHGLRADVMALPGRMPRLQVAPMGHGASEDVYAWRCQDGIWWYWWPWAERIAVADDLATAVKLICGALAAAAHS